MTGLFQALEAITKKHDDLFAVELEDVEIVFRLPSVKEGHQYSLLLDLCKTESDRSSVYESIFRNFVQDEWLTKSAGDIKAGIPETVARLIMMLSGLDEHHTEYTEYLFKAYREQLSSDISYMERVICEVFPGYTFELLESLNYQKLVSVFIQAEKVLIKNGRIEKEHDFVSQEQAKPKPFRVEDVIRQDRNAHKEFETPDRPDPKMAARMQKIREGVIKRAQEEERKFNRAVAKSQNQ